MSAATSQNVAPESAAAGAVTLRPARPEDAPECARIIFEAFRSVHDRHRFREVEMALELYTDDIVWEAPARDLVLRGKEAAAENYRRMFSSFKVEEFRCLERFATGDRVVDDSVATVVLNGDGVENAPAPVGSKVEIRLLHVFDMREGKIARELVFDNWKVIEPAAGHVPYTTVASAASTQHATH